MFNHLNFKTEATYLLMEDVLVIWHGPFNVITYLWENLDNHGFYIFSDIWETVQATYHMANIILSLYFWAEWVKEPIIILLISMLLIYIATCYTNGIKTIRITVIQILFNFFHSFF